VSLIGLLYNIGMNIQHTLLAPSSIVQNVTRDALLDKARKVLAYDEPFMQLVKLCKFDNPESITRLVYEKYFPVTAAFSELSGDAKRVLGGVSDAPAAENAAVVEFYNNPARIPAHTREEVHRYFTVNRLIGHWGFNGELGNGFGQGLMNLSSYIDGKEDHEIIDDLTKCARHWRSDESQIAKFALGQLPQYKGQTIEQAMQRLPRELMEWMHSDTRVTQEDKAMLTERVGAYNAALSQVEELLNMAEAYASKSQKQPTQSRG
jgi:hypothetical protein